MKVGQQQVDTRSDIYSLGITSFGICSLADAICGPID